MSHPLMDKMRLQMQGLEQQGLLRKRRLANSNHAIDFSHNDYLGLASSEAQANALYEGALHYGVGSKASPLVSGYSKAHVELEQSLCQYTGHEAAMLFCSGFSANSALMSALFNQDDVVIADKYVHASIITGIQSSNAKLARFIHNDLASAAAQIARYPRSTIVTESIFSMDGDIAPIDALSTLAKAQGSLLIVDDAHGFGVLPQGVISAEKVDIQIVTFGKALGCQGAAILASQTVIDFLVANSRHYIYSTALSPACAHLALNAVNLCQKPAARAKLMANISLFRAQAKAQGINLSEMADSETADSGMNSLELVSSLEPAEMNSHERVINSPIQPIITGSNERTMAIASTLADKGFIVGAIRSPTVPFGQARLRITLSALHSSEQIISLVNALKCALEDTP
ncbi:aminotransferase class I/II-fold pyridoxal phosphate-dependent enzyme [Shewanella sp.]|uniref:aminotransferase class I/II-fold pyridoxal phosphate-dependent enzyme n=1 Tax=Shewanella sp. TaxID=50422 RepID=UPI004053864E